MRKGNGSVLLFGYSFDSKTRDFTYELWSTTLKIKLIYFKECILFEQHRDEFKISHLIEESLCQNMKNVNNAVKFFKQI